MPFCLPHFLFGEKYFFVAGGYAVALHEQYWIILLIWLGAIGGDCISYMIGCHYGMALLNQLTRKRPKLRFERSTCKTFNSTQRRSYVGACQNFRTSVKVHAFYGRKPEDAFFPVSYRQYYRCVDWHRTIYFAGWALAKGIDLWGR